MVDVLTREQRSLNMSRIRGRDTRPEMIVRRLVHAAGYRYRLHRRDLPGRPDLVFSSRRKIIFVHGCFWHRHDCPAGRVRPATNAKFWNTKIAGNVTRDGKSEAVLAEQGWSVLVVWECETRDLGRLERTLQEFLDGV
jgi:DNA mismatch endonuclease (patch repair protein)